MPALPDRAHGKVSTHFLGKLCKLLLVWRVRIRDRRHLTTLSDHLLHDIGISRDDIEREPSHSFWRVER
jgi:uncharacterized protein YjiS (DUF1127 family)